MKYHINLVSKKEMSVVDKTLYFFLNYVRYILVITQLTVIGVLFFRFRIDQNIIDLKDSIAQKQAIIEVFQPSFEEAAAVNTQLTSIQNIVDGQTRQNESVDYLMSRFPQAVFLNKLNLSDGAYIMTGTTNNSQVLQDYYALLLRDGRFKSVELSNIQRTETGYSFTLRAGEYTP